jgi:hypothetical protein
MWGRWGPTATLRTEGPAAGGRLKGDGMAGGGLREPAGRRVSSRRREGTGAAGRGATEPGAAMARGNQGAIFVWVGFPMDLGPYRGSGCR